MVVGFHYHSIQPTIRIFGGKTTMRLIFDGHLDLALFALAHNRDQTESVAQINAREAHMTDALERGWGYGQSAGDAPCRGGDVSVVHISTSEARSSTRYGGTDG